MVNRAKRQMENGEMVLGTFFEMGGANAVECLGIAGMDYLVIDTEHGPFGEESAADFVRGAKLRSITPFARTRDGSRSSVMRLLDLGVEGLIIPNIQSAAEAKQLVEYGKYYPVGRRGLAFARNSGWGRDAYAADLIAYMETCNRETLLLPQCETIGCLEAIEEIAGIDGIDGIFIGPFDLSVALGKPAIMDTPEFLAAIRRILEACKAAGKFALIYTGSPAQAREYFNQGFDSVAVGMDTMFYIDAFKGLIDAVKS